MPDTNCTCGWLLSNEGSCGNPDHDQVLLRVAAEVALDFLTATYPTAFYSTVVADLRAALGK